MPQTALTERRSWHVQCRRRLVIECELGEIVRATDDLGSARAAEAKLRDLGWTIHADGSASCPVCVGVIDGEHTLTVRGSISAGNDGGLEALRVPDGEVYRDGRWHNESTVTKALPTEDDAIAVEESEDE